MSNTVTQVEDGVNAALPIVEGVANQVISEAPHQTVLSDILNAVNAAAPIVTAAGSALAPTTATQVVSGISALQAVLAFLKAIL